MFDQLRNRRACYKNASRLFGKDGESNGATLSFVLFFFPKNVNRCSSEIKPEEITRSDGKITGPVCGDYEHVSDSGKSRDRGRINIYSQGMAKREREREREKESQYKYDIRENFTVLVAKMANIPSASYFLVYRNVRSLPGR